MHNDRTGKELTFNDLAYHFSANRKFMARYFTYKDWRDRGLIIKEPERKRMATSSKAQHIKRYRHPALKLKGYRLKGHILPRRHVPR